MESGYLYSKDQSEFFNSVIAKFKSKTKRKKQKVKEQQQHIQQPRKGQTNTALLSTIEVPRKASVPQDTGLHRVDIQREPSDLREVMVRSAYPPIRPQPPILPVEANKPPRRRTINPRVEAVPSPQQPPYTRKYPVNGMTITVERDTPSHFSDDSDDSPLLPPGAPAPVPLMEREGSMTSAEFKEMLESVGWKANGDRSVVQDWVNWVDSVNTGSHVPVEDDQASLKEPWSQDADVEEMGRWLDSFGFRGDDVKDDREWI